MITAGFLIHTSAGQSEIPLSKIITFSFLFSPSCLHLSVAEWSAHQTDNLAVLGSRPTLATSWICSQLSQVQILRHTCKQPTGCLLPVGVLNAVMLYYFELFVSKYLSGVPVNQLDKLLHAPSTIKRPLSLFPFTYCQHMTFHDIPYCDGELVHGLHVLDCIGQ